MYGTKLVSSGVWRALIDDLTLAKLDSSSSNSE